jgi:hypothetical protein
VVCLKAGGRWTVVPRLDIWTLGFSGVEKSVSTNFSSLQPISAVSIEVDLMVLKSMGSWSRHSSGLDAAIEVKGDGID